MGKPRGLFRGSSDGRMIHTKLVIFDFFKQIESRMQTNPWFHLSSFAVTSGT
jgi:hypothetical protein